MRYMRILWRGARQPPYVFRVLVDFFQCAIEFGYGRDNISLALFLDNSGSLPRLLHYLDGQARQISKIGILAGTVEQLSALKDHLSAAYRQRIELAGMIVQVQQLCSAQRKILRAILQLPV